jgi:hypothetical protein
MDLQALSNKELSVALHSLVKHERVTSAQILAYLNEVARREIYLHEGYGSLFDYCTRKLRYSEPAANRRIASARAAHKYPEAYKLLVQGELSLTTLSLIAGRLTEDHKGELLQRIRGKSRTEVEAILAELCPKTKTVERVRPVVVAAAVITEQPKTIGAAIPTPPPSQPEAQPFLAPQASTEKRYKLTYAVDEETFAMLEEAKILLSSKAPTGLTLAELTKLILKEFLDGHSPEKKEKRRAARAVKKAPKEAQASKRSKPSRRIPARLRDQVYIRDGGCCAYRSPEGVRCSCTHNLQIDHLVPFAKGGSTELENLRLICAAHNRHLAVLHFGSEHMAQFSPGK